MLLVLLFSELLYFSENKICFVSCEHYTHLDTIIYQALDTLIQLLLVLILPLIEAGWYRGVFRKINVSMSTSIISSVNVGVAKCLVNLLCNYDPVLFVFKSLSTNIISHSQLISNNEQKTVKEPINQLISTVQICITGDFQMLHNCIM
jgi:hypothetical protein